MLFRYVVATPTSIEDAKEDFTKILCGETNVNNLSAHCNKVASGFHPLSTPLTNPFILEGIDGTGNSYFYRPHPDIPGSKMWGRLFTYSTMFVVPHAGEDGTGAIPINFYTGQQGYGYTPNVLTEGENILIFADNYHYGLFGTTGKGSLMLSSPVGKHWSCANQQNVPSRSQFGLRLSTNSYCDSLVTSNAADVLGGQYSAGASGRIDSSYGTIFNTGDNLQPSLNQSYDGSVGFLLNPLPLLYLGTASYPIVVGGGHVYKDVYYMATGSAHALEGAVITDGTTHLLGLPVKSGSTIILVKI